LVKRRGIGATSASAVIFSVILISNLALFVASQDRARLYSQADAEDSMADGAISLAGGEEAVLLLRAQTMLGSQTLDCSTARGTIANKLAGLSSVQVSGVLTVSLSASLGPSAYARDSIPMLAPFNGSLPGELDLSVQVTAAGNDHPAGVSFNRAEVHLVHLPVRMDTAVKDCLNAVQTIEREVPSIVPANCTARAVNPLMTEAELGPAGAASRDGFRFALGYAVAEGSQCSVSFRVSIVQPEIPGPGGTFTVQMQGEGSASFGRQESPRQG
jgi:hypothetical protein